MKKSNNKSIGNNAGRNRSHNRRVVLDYVRDNEPAGRAEIARSCSLSIQAVSNIIESLEQDGLLKNIGYEKGKRGKPVVQYVFNSKNTFSIGIEIRPDRLLCAAVNLNGEVIYKNNQLLSDATPDKAIPAICSMVNNAIMAIKRNKKQLLGVGVVLPSSFGSIGINEVDQSNLPMWDNIDLKPLLLAALNCPILVENDANAVAIAERISGNATHIDNFCYIYFGTGLGMGAISEGNAIRGMSGNFGEIGHIVTQIGGNLCSCGNQGCLETYVSHMSAKNHLEKFGIDQADYNLLEKLMNDHNPILLNWIEEAVKHLSLALNIIDTIFDPETIILGGAMPSNILDTMIAKLKTINHTANPHRNRMADHIIKGSSGPFTAAIGGAAMIIHNITSPHSPNIIERKNMPLTDTEKLQFKHSNPRILDLWKALHPLRSCLSFMNTGAHPDDETTPMLTALGMRDGVKISHACANRGEGGQNIIGREIAKDLGAIRTREMERAAEIINMTHYWLSETSDDAIYDFGFSKSGKETLDIWGEERVLKRFVFILRRERPDIICPTFLDISGQHGHHQAMTRSAFKAVIMAADPLAFPEQLNDPKFKLDIWQVKKIYLPAWSGAGDAYDDDVPPPPATTQIEATGADPVLGMDYAQIAQYSRSFHRTQGMGQWIKHGAPSVWPLNLAWSFNGKISKEKSIFNNLPSNLSDLADYANTPKLKKDLEKAQTAMNDAIAAWPNDKDIKNHAANAMNIITKIKQDCPIGQSSEIIHRLKDKQKQLANLLALVNEIQCHISLSQNEVNAGNPFSLTIELHSPNVAVSTKLVVPDGWEILSQNDHEYQILVDINCPPTNPFPDTWHPDQANEQFYVVLTWQEGNQEVWLSVDADERLHILPAYSAELSQTAGIINLSSRKNISFEISDIHPKGGNVHIDAGDGWQVEHGETLVTLKPTSNLPMGQHKLPISINSQPAQFVKRMNYPHIGTTNRCIDAHFNVCVMDVKLPKGRIAYIGGGNDRTDFWLRKLGIEIESLNIKAVQNVDFSNFDTILIGIFAFRTCSSLNDRLKDLHEWVHNGGNLVTLYHRPWDNWDRENTPLAPIEIGKPSLRWRVTNQNAKVDYLQPKHALLNIPNKIIQDDWNGWDKERGLYFAASWDPAYTALLSMADPDEEPLTGSLLSANIGKGRHTHTSLILHHQVERLVPGAYKILANLLNNDQSS